MKKKRRKELADIFGALQDLKERLDVLTDEEQSAYDNMPESFRDSERGEEMSDTICDLEDVYDSLDTACDTLEEIVTK